MGLGNVFHNTESDSGSLGFATKLVAGKPERWVVAGGDLNVYPRPDDPFPGKPSDQLGSLYEAGLFNLYDRILEERPSSAYTYVYRGQAGTLDHLMVSESARAACTAAHIVHINADYTAGPAGDGNPPRGVSDHDPVAARFKVGAP